MLGVSVLCSRIFSEFHLIFPADSESYWGSYFKYRKRCLCALLSLGAGVDGGRCRVPLLCAAHKSLVVTVSAVYAAVILMPSGLLALQLQHANNTREDECVGYFVAPL